MKATNHMPTFNPHAEIMDRFAKNEELLLKLLEIVTCGSHTSEVTELKTRQQAAYQLKVSLPTLDQLVKTGQLKAKKIGRSVKFRSSDLDEYMNK